MALKLAMRNPARSKRCQPGPKVAAAHRRVDSRTARTSVQP